MRVKTKIKAGKALTEAITKTTEALGLDKLSEKYTQKTGRECGCKKRKAILDNIMPI